MREKQKEHARLFLFIQPPSNPSTIRTSAMTKFEDLANELILSVIEHLSIVNCFRAFHGLNQRLNSLLLFQHSPAHLDLRSIPKSKFHQFCTDHLPSLIDHIVSLHLSDGDATPNLPEIFLSSGLSIDRFTHLQSLSLYHIQSFHLFIQLIEQCHLLTTLHHLHLIQCYFNYGTSEIKRLLNEIWTLPQLISCKIDQINSRRIPFRELVNASSTLRTLIIEKTTGDPKDLSSIFHFSPSLEHLTLNYMYGFIDGDLSLQPLRSLTSLCLTFHGSIDALTYIFQYLPNLIHLQLKTGVLCCGGDQWETILRHYLPHLQVFQLKMSWNFSHSNEIDALLETFRSPFWLDEHQWYVRCDWDPQNIFSDALLYTLPYAFDDCFYFDSICSKSTCPDQLTHWCYSAVKMLSHEFPENDGAKDPVLFSARFPKIECLKLSFAFDNSFWFCLPSFEHLSSLSITSLHTDEAYDQLQELLRRAKRLSSIVISYPNNIGMRFFSLISPSLRYLSFIPESSNDIRYFHPIECKLLAHAPLTQTCELLMIAIRFRRSLFDLIPQMIHLQSLICQCEDDQYNQWNSIDIQDEFIDWCRNHFHSSHSIHRDPKRPSLVRFWISQTSIA